MKRARSLLLVLVSLVAFLGLASTAAALPLGDALPALPVSPATIPVAEGGSAVYSAELVAGELLVLSLSPASGAPATLDLDLRVFGPSATDTTVDMPLADSRLPATSYPETITYQALQSGRHYVEIAAFEGTGSGALTWSVLPEPLLPVYRFYNNRTGTHFYTPSESERQTVQSTLGHLYTFEGVAYHTKATKNTQSLYRFYNNRSGTHFYTASESERERVATTMTGTFTYEGATYKVSPTGDGGKTAVYRFYNRRTGSHFYTASYAEMQTVSATLGYLYTFEGVAFYLGQ